MNLIIRLLNIGTCVFILNSLVLPSPKIQLKITYASKELTIDDDKIAAIDWNIQILYLLREFAFSKMKHFVLADPECQLLNICD